jgi:hypothetical protein
MAVSTAPGHSTLTFTPCSAASGRKVVLSPTTACFEAAYATVIGVGARPAIEAVLTICPCPWATIRG